MVMESILNSLLAQAIATIIVAILLNVTANRLPAKFADPLLRWGWFSVFLYFTYLFMSIDFIQRKLVPLAGSPIRSYVFAGLVGVLLAVVYWASVIRLHDKLLVQTDPPEQKQKMAPTPAQTLLSPADQAPSSLSTPATTSQPSPPITAKSVNSKRAKIRTRSEPSSVNQSMTNSANGIQAGRDVTIGSKPSPTPREEDKKH